MHGPAVLHGDHVWQPVEGAVHQAARAGTERRHERRHQLLHPRQQQRLLLRRQQRVVAPQQCRGVEDTLGDV